MRRLPHLRLLILLMALFWLGHLSVRQLHAQRLDEQVRTLNEHVQRSDIERAQAAGFIEARLVKIETQLQQLNDTTNKAVWGALGTMALVVVNALLGLVIRKPNGGA